ncbi:MAG: DEAD/DEAH box helicase family protein, partial [Culicoidibacterales bacterium]
MILEKNISLRDYQIQAIQNLKTAIAKGSKSPCLVSPCGSGKSIITAEIAKSATNKQNRVLFLVHRKELCEQIAETFTNYGVNMDFCDIQMV